MKLRTKFFNDFYASIRKALIMVLLAIAILGSVLTVISSNLVWGSLPALAALFFSMLEGLTIAEERYFTKKTPLDLVEIPSTKEAYIAEQLEKFKQKPFFRIENKAPIEHIKRNFVYWDKEIGQEQHFTNLEEPLQLFTRFVLVGDPGSGKTASLEDFFKYSANTYKQNAEQPSPLPFWIQLGKKTNSRDIETLIKDWLQTSLQANNLDAMITRRQILLFLDGLDEVPRENQGDLVSSMKNYFHENTHLPIIISCRAYDYEYQSNLQVNFPVLRLAPLNKAQISEFVAAYMGENSSLYQAIIKDEAQSHVIYSMAENPFTLEMLIGLYNRDRQRTLPKDFGTLYDEYIKGRYDREWMQRYDDKYKNLANRAEQREAIKANRSQIDASWQRLRGKLEKLAFRMISEAYIPDASIDWARELIGTDYVKEAVDTGILEANEASETNKRIRFFHMSLHGYFAAKPIEDILTPKLIRFDKEYYAYDINRRIEFVKYIAALGEAAQTYTAILLKLYLRNDLELELSIELIRAFGQIRFQGAIEHLIKLDHEKHNLQLCEAAVSALGYIGRKDNKVQSYLSKSLLNPTYHLLSLNSAKALQVVGDNKEVLKSLIQVQAKSHLKTHFGDTIATLLVEADKALNIIINRDESGEALVTVRRELVAILTDLDPVNYPEDLRIYAARKLADFGTVAEIPSLEAALQDNQIQVKIAAVKALKALGSLGSLPHLERLFTDEWKGRDQLNWDLFENLVDAFVALAPKSTNPLSPVPLIVQILHDNSVSREMLYKYLIVLGKLPSTQSIMVLERLLDSEDPRQRDLVVDAFIAIGNNESVKILNGWQKKETDAAIQQKISAFL